MAAKRNSKTQDPDLEQRVRELTERSLELLDDLAKARVRLGDSLGTTEKLHDRCQRLEVLLEDARRRVRSTRCSRDWRPTTVSTGELEVVIWSPSAQPAAKMVSESVSSVENIPTTVVTVAPAELADNGETRNLEPTIQTPAAQWNTAMAATDAPVVLFLQAGVQMKSVPTAEQLELLAQPSVGMLQPCIDDSLGLRQTETFLFEPQAIEGGDGPVELDYVSPGAFLVSRQAFEVLGTFDEGLLSWASLVEHCRRAADHSMRLLGLPELSATGDVELAADAAEHDRLILTAIHQPAALGRMLASAEVLWSLRGEELRGFLGNVLGRLPGAGQAPDLVQVLVEEGVKLSANTLDGAELIDRIRLLSDSLAGMHGMPCGNHGEARAIAAELEKTAAQPTGDSLQAAFEALGRRVQFEHRIKVELNDAANGLDSDNEALRAEVDRLHNALAELREELEQANQRTVETKERMTQEIAERELRLTQLDKRLAQEVAQRDRQLAQLDEQARHVEGEYKATLSTLRETEQAIDHLSQSLGTGGGKPVESALSIAARFREFEKLLEERNKWVAALLEEMQSRRFVLGRRKMSERERLFLEQFGDVAEE